MARITQRVVISLEGSDRITRFLAQPEGQGFRVFNAFDGRRPDRDEYFDVEACDAHYQGIVTPRPGQIGCAVSHRLVLAAFADSPGAPDDLLLVAEDDARFRPGFSTILATIEQSCPWDVVVLADAWSMERRDLQLRMAATRQLSLRARLVSSPEARYRVGRFAGVAYTTGAYLISRRGAQQIISSANSQRGRPFLLADDWREYKRIAGVDIALTSPSAVEWADSISSTAAAPHAAPDRPTHRIRRLAWLREQLAVRSRLAVIRLSLAATAQDFEHRRRSTRVP